MKKATLLGITLLMLMGLKAQAQMMIDTWAFSTGVDTTLWMDLGTDYTTLIATTGGTYENYGNSGLREIGFPFTLGATTHTKFSTNVNGTLRLGTAQMPSGGYIAEPLGQNINAGPRIDAFGRAAMFDPDCYMRSAVLGDSGSRVLVVESRLRDYGNWGAPAGDERYVTFQVQLFEAGGLRIVYGQADSGAVYGTTQNGVAATGNSSNKDVLFIDFAAQRAVRFNGTCSLRNAAENYPVKGRWYALAADPSVCPLPPAVTPIATNAAAVLLPRSAGDSNAYRVALPVTGVDTVWPAGQDTFALPPLNPATSYSLQLQTLCGSDTSYRRSSVDFFTGCGAVRHLPWGTEFASLPYSDCWEMPYETNTADFNRRWHHVQGMGHVVTSSASGTYNSWLKLPIVYLPDVDGITLRWDYKALQQTGVNPVVALCVAPCAEDGTVADAAAWTTLLTFADEYADYETLYTNLDAWRGQRVRVAFVRTGEGGGSAYIDNVLLYQQQEPLVEWETPSLAYVGDTTTFAVRMLAGVDSNVTYTWHSSLLDSTITLNATLYTLNYTSGGWDTVTLVASNAYGSDTLATVVDVLDCGTVTTFPWTDDFSHSSDCWTINGWVKAGGSTAAYDESGNYATFSNVYYSSNVGDYMLTQPMAIPATGAEHLALWVQADGPLTVRVNSTAADSLDTAYFADTLLTVPDNASRKEIWWRTANLASYAGQTVRFGFFRLAGTQAFLSAVRVDYDTLPVLSLVTSPTKTRTDSTIACSVELLCGASDGMTITWHSSLTDTSLVVNGANGFYGVSGFEVHYTVGGMDTITVVASNAFGSDTAMCTVQVVDCTPATVLPWHEGFDDGLDCWYRTESKPYHQWNQSYHGYYDYLAGSQCNFSESDIVAADAWLVSKAIDIPADTALDVRLFWSVGLSSGNNLTNIYRVMVTTATDYADTTAYTVLYCDTTPLPNMWSNLAQRSVSLADYAGQTVHLAFRNQPVVRRATALVIDDVEVRATAMPRLTVASDEWTYHYGDTATFTATLEEGSDSGLVYTWHSTLLDSTIVGDTLLRLCYGLTSGTDTVMVVATNAFGSDTAMVTVTSTIITEPSVDLVAEGYLFPPRKAEMGDTVVYCATRNRCVTTGLTWLFHSSLLDTTITLATTADTVRLPIVYSEEGIDTFTVTLSNLYDTSLTVPVYMEVLDCPAMSVPYFEDFESMTISYAPDCWDGRFWVVQTGDGRGAYFYEMNGDAMLLSPLIDLPADSLGLQLSWASDYTFYINADVPSKVLVSPTGGKHAEDFTDTLYTGALCQNGTGSDSVLLDAYRGSQVRIAFPSIPNATCLYDDIRVDYNRAAPQVSLDLPATVNLYDTVHFAATLNACSPQGLTFTWHSTLLDSTWAANGFDGVDGFDGVYDVAGVDTLMVIAANAYGADTAVAIVEVVDCSGRSLPYTEDFETIAVGTLPACWGNTWTGSNGGYAPRVVDQNSYQVYGTLPGHGLIMVAGTAVGYGTEAMAILPHMADSLQHLSVAFDYRFEVSGQGTLEVGYYDGDTFTALQTMTPQSQTYRRDTVVLNNVAVPDAQIALRWAQGSVWYAVYIDNIEVLQTPASMLAPQVAIVAPASVVLPDSATYTVTLNDRCSLDGLSFTWHSTLLDSTIVSTESIVSIAYPVAGLDTVTVTATNAYGADTATAVVEVYDCGNVALPYVEDFDGVTPIAWNTTGSNLPPCWTYAYTGTNANIHFPTVVSSYQYISNLSGNALLMIAGTTSGYATWVQANLPSFNVPLSSLALAFDYRYESANAGSLVVGYYNDSTDMYYDVDTITPHAGSFLRDTVYFDTVTAPVGARMVLRWIHLSSWYGVAVDNIEVFNNNGILAPATLTVENVTATCATLRWSEVDTATAYRVILSGGMNIDTVVTDTVLTLCNLPDDADYSVRVVTLVGSSEGRSIATSFHTLMLCAPLASVSISPEGIISWQYDTLVAEQTPAGVEIEVIDQQGQVLVLTDTAYYVPYVPAGLTPGHTYSFAVRTLCASATANTADTVVMQVTPSVCAEAGSNTIPSNSGFMDNFWESNYSQVVYPASFAGTIDTIYGIALRVAQYEPYSWQTTSGDCRYDIYVGLTTSTLTSPLTSDSLTMVVQNRRFLLSGTGWKDFLFDTPYVYDGTGNLVVTIVSRQSSDVYEPVYGVHTDATCTHFVQDEDHMSDQINPSTFNFEWEVNTNIPDIRLLGGCGGSVNTCLAPEVEVAATDTHSVSLQWQQRGSESLWQVEYRPVGTNAWTVADTTSATSYTVTGLAQASHYVVRVGAVCSDSLVVYGFPDSATTLCGYMELPYSISFLADEYPCWTLGSSLYHTNWNGVTLSEWNLNGYLISPEIVDNIADLKATITSLRPIAESYESRFAVGVGNADGSNITWIDTIGFLQQNTVQTDEVHFNHYTGNGRHIILRGVVGTCYIRQFSLEAFTGCVPVHDVAVGNIAEHSAQLTWVPEDATNTWAIYLDGSLVGNATTPSYTLIGLMSNTQYTVSVREICDAGDTSTAVTRMFQTLCDAYALPYFEEFDQAPLIGSEHVLTDCWVLHAEGNYATAYCIGDQWSYTCLSFNDNNEGYNVVNYLSSPRLTVGSGGALVSFKGQTTYFDTFTVGIMLSPYDTSTFIPVRNITVSSGGMAWYSFTTDTIVGAPTSGTFTVAFRFNGEGSGIIDSLTVTANPVPTYDLTLNVNDTTMGTVSGAGTYEDGYVALITATPNLGYRFVMWNDSVNSAAREVVVHNDMSFTAFFAPDSTPVTPDTVWRTVTVAANVEGVCETYGSGIYADSSTVEIGYQVIDTVAEGGHWQFTGWDDGSEGNPRNILVTSDTTVTALFQWVEDSVGISELRTPDSELLIYPNPAAGDVTVSVSQPSTLSVIDLTGRTVVPPTQVNSSFIIPKHSLPTGTYFVRIATEGGNAVKKLIIKD